jgi:hypothetical protein
MFKSWCNQNGFLKKVPNPSHVLLDGGCLSVPFDRLNEFYEKYIEAVKADEKIFVVEQKTPTYNFFVDIDYKAEESLGIDAIGDICEVICKCVKKFEGKECIISVAKPKNSGNKIKTGVHLNWPGFVVNQDIAVYLREYILSDLFSYDRNTTWDTIIDSSVYGNPDRKTKGSGFRMPWSHKMNKGVVEGIYLPLFKYTWPLSSLMRINPEPDPNLLKSTAVRTEKPVTISIDLSTKRKEGSFSHEQMKDEMCDSTLRNSLETFIRKNLNGQGEAYITKIYKSKNTFLVSSTSKYCENTQRKHNSNHVWFLISGKQILQKCFCTCPTIEGRTDGFCKDFCGRRHELPSHIVSILYPDKEEIKKCKEITQFVDKPLPNVRTQIEFFLNKWMKVDDNTKIIDMKRQKGGLLLTTTSRFCETSASCHDKLMTYTIKKNEIKQLCPTCKKCASRTHKLTPNIIKLLKQ